jgi:hypothetical protein
MLTVAGVCAEQYPSSTQGYAGEDYITVPLQPLSSLSQVACTSLCSGDWLCSTHGARKSFMLER